MYLMSAQEYKNADVNFLIIRKADKIWVSIKTYIMVEVLNHV